MLAPGTLIVVTSLAIGGKAGGFTWIWELISLERPSSHFMLAKKTTVPSGAESNWSTAIFDTTA